MSISGTILYKKIRELMPGISSSITPEVLNKTCDDPSLQPFLKWLCSNVGPDNVLRPDDIRLKKHIKKKGEWLVGDELDAALAEATKDCPELMKLVSGDLTCGTQFSDEVEAAKDAYKEDMDYLQMLEESLKNLKELGTKLDDDIETEEALLEKDRIKAYKIYADCSSVLEEFDLSHRQFFKDIECLVKVYSEAIEKKGTPVVWTQVPLDLFIKQLEMHNDYLGVYVKRHFGGRVETSNDSDYETLIDPSSMSVMERSGDEKAHELFNCQTDLITLKISEINEKVAEATSSTMAAHAAEIYNGGNLRTPQSETQLRMEIAALTSRRDFLEENVALIRDTQLEEVVRRYARLVISEILVNNGHARLARRSRRLKKLANLRTLAREKGHGQADLLCILMQLQLQRLKEIVEFIADGRHYLATEYRLSSVRCDSMQQQQDKFDEIMKASPSEQNVFNKIFTSLVLETEYRPSNPDDLNAAIKRYDDLVEDNERRKNDLLGVHLDQRIDNLAPLQDEVMSAYNAEIEEGPTNSFKPTPYKLIARLEQSTKDVCEMQDSISRIRASIKDMSRKTADSSFERDTTILWQRFLANPDEMQSKYEETKKKLESSHFVDNLDA